MVYKNIIGKPEKSLDELITKLGRMVKEPVYNLELTDMMKSCVSIYYIIAPKRGGLNPLIPIAECIVNSNFLTDEVAIKNRNPAKIIDPKTNKVKECATWVEGVTLHVDYIASCIQTKGFPRKDTPDIESEKHYGEGYPEYNMTDDAKSMLFWIADIPHQDNDVIVIDTLTDESLISQMKNLGFLGDEEYWLSVIKGKTQASGSNIKSLFTNIVKKLDKK